jgi:hypothetical protein
MKQVWCQPITVKGTVITGTGPVCKIQTRGIPVDCPKHEWFAHLISYSSQVDKLGALELLKSDSCDFVDIEVSASEIITSTKLSINQANVTIPFIDENVANQPWIPSHHYY